MAGLIGIAPTPRAFGAPNPALSAELNALGEGAFAPAAYRRERLNAWAGAFRTADALRWPTTGRLAQRFAEDFFDRIHVLPTALSLGNVVSELTREIAVWNAWRALTAGTRPPPTNGMQIRGCSTRQAAWSISRQAGCARTSAPIG